MYITKISYQKKGKLFEVFFDNNESIFINENTLIKCQLFKGKEINEDQLKEILKENQIYEANEIALKYLKRARTKKEVYNHLKNNNIDEDTIFEVIKYLEKFKYINDQEYCLSFIKDKININRYGPEKIKYLLKAKGISEDMINTTFDNIDPEIIKSNFLKDGENKYRKVSSDKNAYEKTVRFILSKGYSLDYTMKNIGEIIK